MKKDNIVLRNYAHLGDAVWEVFVREYTIRKTSNAKKLHKITTDRVNATFQKEMLNEVMAKLTEDELELVRRARNLPIPIGRKNIQADYRMATAFEVLIGYWYLNNKKRLDYFYSEIKKQKVFNVE